jgi:hypothetical protein
MEGIKLKKIGLKYLQQKMKEMKVKIKLKIFPIQDGRDKDGNQTIISLSSISFPDYKSKQCHS